MKIQKKVWFRTQIKILHCIYLIFLLFFGVLRFVLRCVPEGSDDKSADDDCKIISGHTIFDHIRKKAKDFPVVAKSSAVHFPTAQSSDLPNKRLCEEQHGSSGIAESSAVEDSSDKQQMMTSERQHNDHLGNGDATVLEFTGML